jgi:hypothetical protein
MTRRSADQRRHRSERRVRAIYVFGVPRLLRIASHLNAMGVVNDPVENAVGQGGVADLFRRSLRYAELFDRYRTLL